MLLSAFLIYIYVDRDTALQENKDRRDALKKEIKITQKEDKILINKHKKIIKASFKKIKTLDEAIEVEKKTAPQEVQNLIALYDEKINLLQTEITLRDEQYNELKAALERAHKIENKSLSALNTSIRDLTAEKAKNKAMLIGLSVGIPLALAGGIAAGFAVKAYVKFP